MADELLGLIGTNDLIGFQNSVAQSDPYGLAGRSINAWQPNTSTWDPATTAMTAFGKSFLAGLLGNYARQNAANQTNAVIGVLPQLQKDPMSVLAPEGVNPDAFAALRGISVLKNAQRQEYLDEKNDSRVGSLLQAVLPDLIKNNKITSKDALNIATSEDPLAALDAVNVPDPRSQVAATGPALDSPLANGKMSSLDKYKQYFNDLVASGQPPVQAATAARAQVEGEIKANNKSYDDAKAAREYGQNLLSIANTARAGIADAGQTGSYNTVASAYENIANLFGSKEASKQLRGDTTLDSISPDIIKLARPIGGGATSDFEARAYLGSGPSTKNTPEANLLLVEKMENLGKLNVDYADFIEAYKEANSGSSAGADKKWNEYKESFPIFVKSGNEYQINSNRPSWQEFFAQKGAGNASDIGTSKPVPTGQYTKSGKQIYILNGVKGTID